MQLLDILAQQYAIGRAAIFYYAEGGLAKWWDGTTPLIDGLVHLGNTEGEVNFAPNEEYSRLHLGENFGPGILEEYETGAAPSFEVGIFPTPDSLKLFSPTGAASGGTARQRRTRKRTLWIVPEQLLIKEDPDTGVESEVAITYAGGWLKDGEAFTDAEQDLFDMSIFLWAGVFSRAMPVYRHEDGGKSLRSIEVRGLVDVTKPNGHMIWTIGAELDGSGIDVAGAES